MGQEDELLRMTGAIKRRRDELYLVDCDVAGSSDGSSKDLTCSLQRIFEHNIFPMVKKLVEPGEGSILDIKLSSLEMVRGHIYKLPS